MCGSLLVAFVQAGLFCLNTFSLFFGISVFLVKETRQKRRRSLGMSRATHA